MAGRRFDADGHCNKWRVSETAYFEYHCHMGHDSTDAEVWYRSHQTVSILAIDHAGVGRTARLRIDAGEPRLYKVLWGDGFEYVVYEDELFVNPSYFSTTFNPPPVEDIAAARATRGAQNG